MKKWMLAAAVAAGLAGTAAFAQPPVTLPPGVSPPPGGGRPGVLPLPTPDGGGGGGPGLGTPGTGTPGVGTPTPMTPVAPGLPGGSVYPGPAFNGDPGGMGGPGGPAAGPASMYGGPGSYSTAGGYGPLGYHFPGTGQYWSRRFFGGPILSSSQNLTRMPTLPVYMAAPWYLYWPYDGHFQTIAPMAQGLYYPPPANTGNAFMTGRHPGYMPNNPQPQFPMGNMRQ